MLNTYFLEFCFKPYFLAPHRQASSVQNLKLCLKLGEITSFVTHFKVTKQNSNQM